MLYWSVLLVIVGFAVLTLSLVLVRSAGQVAKTRTSLLDAKIAARDRVGLVRARVAALRLAFAQRSRGGPAK